MWQPDGAGWRASIGVLTPGFDPVPESEFQAMAPEGVSIHAARVPLGTMGPDGVIQPLLGPDIARAFAEPPHVDDAVALLSGISLNAIVFAFTSSSYLTGPDADAALIDRLQKRSRGIPIVLCSVATVVGLRRIGAKRLALIHPPWFSTELDKAGVDYLENQGFEVVHHAIAPLRSGFGEIPPEQIYDFAKAHAPASADAVFFGGSGFRSIGVIQALEDDLRRPVMSTNQVAFWYALRRSGVDACVAGYGRLFEMDLPEDQAIRGI
jgi:maleate isomerase